MPDALIEAGYETDERWLELLDGVTPARPSRSRARAILRDLDRRIRYSIKSWRYLSRRR
jgi:hypothetical protein